MLADNNKFLEYSGAHAIGCFESHCILASSYTMTRPKRFICFFDYWTVFSTLIQFIHELAPRSLWLKGISQGWQQEKDCKKSQKHRKPLAHICHFKNLIFRPVYSKIKIKKKTAVDIMWRHCARAIVFAVRWRLGSIW